MYISLSLINICRVCRVKGVSFLMHSLQKVPVQLNHSVIV